MSFVSVLHGGSQGLAQMSDRSEGLSDVYYRLQQKQRKIKTLIRELYWLVIESKIK